MKLAIRLIRAVLPRTPEGSSTLGDLLEEHHRRGRGLGRELWLWAVAGDVVIRYWPSKGASMASAVGRDLRFAVRLARRSPIPSVAIVLSLGLAIGVGTAAFTVANVVWLRRTLAADSSLVKIWRDYRGVDSSGSSWAWPETEFRELRGRSHDVRIEGLASTEEPVQDSGGDTALASVAFVTGGFFRMMNARPAVGRLIEPSDDGPGATAVTLDHLYWRRHYAADPAIVGRPFTIRGVTFTIVGVAPRDFVDPSGRSCAMWAPLGALERVNAGTPGPVPSKPIRPFAIGRLAPGTTIRAAQDQLASLAVTLAPAPKMPRVSGVQVGPVISETEVATHRRILTGVFSVIGLVLLLACANVSNLLMSSVASRHDETAIRLSCGASRRRLACQFGLEAALLVSIAGAAGVILSRWLAPIVATGMGAAAIDLEPDVSVYGFAILITAAVAIGTGLAPAVHAARRDVLSVMPGPWSRRNAPGRPARAMSLFVALQAAASIVLVSLAALQVRALVHLAFMDPGFDVSSVVSLSVDRPRSGADVARGADFSARLLARVRALPGVDNASVATFVPLGLSLGDPDQIQTNAIDSSYFATLGMRVVRGRSFTPDEVSADVKVAVISEQLMRRYWGDADPLGASAARIDPDLAVFLIVGVAGDVIADRIHSARTPIVYVPNAGDRSQIAVHARAPAAAAADVLAVARSIAPELHPRVSVLGDDYARQFERPRRYALLASAVAAFGLLLSAVGLFGVTAYAVRARTREMGIRMALGARSGDVLTLVMRQGLRPVLIGLAAGFATALLAGRVVAGALYGLSDRDPIALSTSIVLMLAVATTAIVMPTRRLARLDPARTLRES